MKRIMITGSLGQIGSELALYLANIYGEENILVTDLAEKTLPDLANLAYKKLDVTDFAAFKQAAQDFAADTIMHLAAILSARGETMPQTTYKVNMNGLFNALEVARELHLQLFCPSSIGSFGPGTPMDNTPQDTLQRPETMYGVTKVSGELLCDYYYKRFGVDARGVRFPGLISWKTLPGQGTTDYAVHIYYAAIKEKSYTSYIKANTFMDMMYLPDALQAIVDLMEAPAEKLQHRNAFNVSAMSVDPEMIAASIRKFIPEFTLKYEVDPVRQQIAESWPNSLDVSAAQKEWNFKVRYDLDKMTEDMLSNLRVKLGKA